jgi:phosphatidyl-myo-inositol dimannoside synthase
MILFATQNFYPSVGGTQIFVTGMADALSAKGHAIEVYCDAASREAARKVDAARAYKIVRFGGPRPLMRRLKARAVVKRLAQGDVTALITDTWKSLEHLPPKSLQGVRVMCMAHGNEFLHGPETGKGKLLKRCLAKADIVQAVSHFTAGLVRPFLTGKTRVAVLLPGVIPPDGASRDARPHAQNDVTRILTVARLEPRKGIDKVLRALPALAAKHPKLRYDIIGKGDDRARLDKLVAELGVSKLVHFHGYVSDAEKADLLTRADVFVLANRREHRSVEGFGSSFMEAAAYGVPEIAGSDGGTSDAVVDGTTGLVVDGESDAAVRDALMRMLDDPDRRREMGRAAHERYWREFAWDKAVDRFEAVLFDKLLR